MVNRPKDYANEIEDVDQFILTKTLKKGSKMHDKLFATKLATALKKGLDLPDKVNHTIQEINDKEDFIYAGSAGPRASGRWVVRHCTETQYSSFVPIKVVISYYR